MKSVKYIVLIVASLGVIASVFNIFYEGSFSVMGLSTLWPSIALFAIVFASDKQEKPASQK